MGPGTSTTHDAIEHVLAFWFADGREAQWFERSETFDAAVREALEALHLRAAAGTLDHWAETPRGALALVILLDQVPRNLYRGTARAFATDAKARAVCRAALDAGHDAALASAAERLFLYLPLEHSEDLADQERCVGLVAALGDAEQLRYAERHREIVQRFGRFPHRNAALGRETTEAEAAFLQEPESSF